MEYEVCIPAAEDRAAVPAGGAQGIARGAPLPGFFRSDGDEVRAGFVAAAREVAGD
jgi:hypothetical protein